MSMTQQSVIEVSIAHLILKRELCSTILWYEHLVPDLHQHRHGLTLCIHTAGSRGNNGCLLGFLLRLLWDH